MLQQSKIWFNFQFPRSPDAAFRCLIGRLSNWKCRFSCRIISNITNYLKHNYFRDGDSIDNVTLRLWKISDFWSRHTVGVAGNDIMFHILVINRTAYTWIDPLYILKWCPFFSGWYSRQWRVGSHRCQNVVTSVKQCSILSDNNTYSLWGVPYDCDIRILTLFNVM